MPEQPAGPQINSTERADAVTAEAPPFRAPGRPIDTGSLQLRGLPSAGERIDDFELVRLLGTGAFARVFLAKQVSLGRLVALKVSHNRGQEARTLASLEHDHIVRVFSEVIDPQRNLRLLCMQYVSGTTLEHIIERFARLPPEQRDGRALLAAVDEQALDPAALDLASLRDRELLGGLDPLEAGCWLGARLAEALAHAHGLGVLHRDVKPANVLINRYGRPLLADFNVSVRQDSTGERSIGGTLAYMAPEHLDAFAAEDCSPDSVDARGDLYSLGVVLHELFTGRLPFAPPGEGPRGEEFRQAAEQRRAGAPPLSDHVNAPAAVERVVAGCLAPRPEDRPPSAAELAADLESCRELCRARRDLPPGRWLTRATLARPFLFAAILISLPHLLGSAVNITYNSLRIVSGLSDTQKVAFFWILLPAYNAVVYPVCLGLFFREWLLVYRVWQRLARGGTGAITPAEVDDARRRALRLPVWCATLSAIGWLPGGVLFPLLLDLSTRDLVGALTYGKFLFSFTVSGLIALTYSVIAVEFVVVRVLYPGLWLDARRLRETAKAELAREEGRLAVLQFLSVLIPLAGASLLLGVSPAQVDAGNYLWFRVLVATLLATGALGMALAILTAREVRQAVDAFTARGRE